MRVYERMPRFSKWHGWGLYEMKKKWQKEIKSFSVGIISSGIYSWLLVIVVFMLCIVIFLLSNYYGPIFNVEIINASVAFTLLFLTFMYIITTKEIINESVIERKKTFIEKRIEKLYAPLISNKNLLQLTHENLNQIKTYQHLASDDLKPLLKEYIKLFDNEAKNVSTEHGEAIYLKHIDPEFQEKIRAQIREDYDSLIEELYNIHK